LQYGQTVIASDASYNALYGPFARKIERRLQQCLRDDVIADVGFSDRDLGRLLRERGLVDVFLEEPMQMDISRQDSSHSKVTLLLFGLLIEYLGMPCDLVELYLEKRSLYKVRSMAPCLYSGVLAYNLPSGDPFTLFCNIIHALTVLIERMDVGKIAIIVKGDDLLLSRKPRLATGITIDEIRAVKVEYVYNGIAYHAGRFLIPNGNLMYDPVRYVLKFLAKSDSTATDQEIALSLYERHMWFDGYAKKYLQYAIPRQYQEINERDARLVVRITNSLKNGKLYWKCVLPQLRDHKRPIFEATVDCAYELGLYLGWDTQICEELRELSSWVAYQKFKQLYGGNVYYSDKGIPRKARLSGGVVVTRDHVFLF